MTALLGERATPEKRAALTAALGLDQPISSSTCKFLARMLTRRLRHLDAVPPGRDAIDVFLTRFPATLELTIGAMIIAIGVRHPARLPGRQAARPVCSTTASSSAR